MENGENKNHQLQSLGICNKLFNFMKFLPTHFLKMLTSDRFPSRSITQASGLSAAIEASPKNDTGHVVLQIAQGTPSKEVANIEAKTNNDVPSSTSNERNEAGEKHIEVSQALEDNEVADAQHQEEEPPLPNSDAAATSDAVASNKAPKKMVSINDYVETINIGKKRSKKNKLQVADQPMPLKSILKVGSDVNNIPQPERLLSRANGA